MKFLILILTTSFLFTGCDFANEEDVNEPTEEAAPEEDPQQTSEEITPTAQEILEEVTVTAQRKPFVEGAPQQEILEEVTVTAQRRPSESNGVTSTVINCSGNNTTYEIRRAADSSCNRMESVCCGLYLTEAGGSSTLISDPNLGTYQCNVFGSIARNGSYNSFYLAEGHRDKVDLHIGMNCVQQ